MPPLAVLYGVGTYWIVWSLAVGLLVASSFFVRLPVSGLYFPAAALLGSAAAVAVALRSGGWLGAAENVAKGLVVQREDPVQGDRLAGWFMTHDVHALLVRASIPLSDNETHTCAVLRAYVEWAGKYPVSSRLSASGPQETAAGGFIPTAGWFRPENKVAVDALFEKEPHRPAARNPSRRPA
jgi:hypothetical protein